MYSLLHQIDMVFEARENLKEGIEMVCEIYMHRRRIYKQHVMRFTLYGKNNILLYFY